MINFKDWLLAQESSPHTRAVQAASQGLLPMATVGSIHGGRTAPPGQLENIKKLLKKHKKKFGASKSKKKITNIHMNKEVDNWLKEIDALKTTLAKWNDASEKKAKEDDKKAKEDSKKSKDAKNKEEKDLKTSSGKDKLPSTIKDKEESDERTNGSKQSRPSEEGYERPKGKAKGNSR